MRIELADIIMHVHKKSGRSQLKAEDIRFLLYTSRRCDVLLVFVAGAAKPEYVIKLTRNPENKIRVANEFKVCKFLESLVSWGIGKYITPPKELAGSSGRRPVSWPGQGAVPRVLYESTLQGHYLIVETFLGDKSLNEKLYSQQNSYRGISRIFSEATDWLISLASATSSKRQSIPDFLDNGYWAESWQKFQLGNHQEIPKEFSDAINSIVKEAKERDNCFISGVLGHNDFSPYNIFFESATGKIRVIDWEVARENAAPLVDLLNFFTISQSVLRGFKESQAARVHFSFSRNIHNIMPIPDDLLVLFYQNSWQNKLVRENVLKYIQALDLDKRLLRLVFLLYILRHLNHSPKFLELFLQKENVLLL